MTDDARPDETDLDEQPEAAVDDLLARLERLFEAPIGETGMAVHFDPEAREP